MFVLTTAALALLCVSAGAAWAQLVVPRNLGVGLAVVAPAADAPRDIENPGGRLTLRDALRRALLQNPDLALHAWEVRAREADALQANRPPNPTLDGVLEDLGAAAVGEPQATLQLSQLIELGGKRAARHALASIDRDLAEWDRETVRIDVFTGVAAAFIDVLAGQERVAVTRRALAIAEQVHAAVRARVDAGMVSPIEQSRSSVALAAARIDMQTAARRLDADRVRLATWWGAEAAVFDAADGDLSDVPPLPAFEDLRGHISAHPAVARWAAEIARRDAARAVEAAARMPDVTVSAGVRRFTSAGGSAWVAGASVPLPLFDRNRDAVRAAEARTAGARESQLAARARVTAALAAAFGDLAGAHDAAASLAADVVPAARAAFEAVEEGYRLGRFGLLDVLDAQRTLVESESRRVDALANVHKGVAAVERLTGTPIRQDR